MESNETNNNARIIKHHTKEVANKENQIMKKHVFLDREIHACVKHNPNWSEKVIESNYN